MADFISVCLSPLIQAICSFGVQGATDEYTFYYGYLDDQCNDLASHLEDVVDQVTQAKSEGLKIRVRVDNWINCSNSLVLETRTFLGPEEDLRTCCCFVFLGSHCLCCCSSDGIAIKCLRCCCSNANSCFCRPKKKKAAEVLVDRIQKQLEVGNFPEGVSVPTTSGPSRAPYVEIASQQAQLNKITELLGGGKVSVIGVYGNKGSGKSTLIDKVAMEADSSNQFNAVVKLTMGERDAFDIQLEIAEKIGLKLPLLEDPRARARWLHGMLSYLEKVVFIIDNVEKEVDLNEIGIPWPDHNNGCRIVLVSRSFEGLGKIRTQLDLELEVIPFSNDELRELNLDQKKPNKPDKLQTLNYNMERLERRASDINDEVRKELLQNRKRKMGEVKLWLERVERIRQEVQNVSGEVEDSALEGMTKQVNELIEQCNFPRGLVLELPTGKLEGSTPLEVQNEVWSAFRNGESRVGIFGMGGLGKTSVAMHINNEILARRDDFKHVYYATVSRDSSVHKLQEDISRALNLWFEVEDDETKRAAELRMSLKNREKSLLILDDIWEDINMDKVGVVVEGDGCKLIITTRDRDVCDKMKCSTIVEMRPLSKNEAWDLFVGKLGNYEQLSDEAKRISTSICEECSGIPLAIITMGSCMRGELDEHVWREMLRLMRNPSSNQDDRVFNILKLSYERLNNDNLRECLLHCALYPEDEEIQWDDLIKDFIAAGLLDGSTRKENIDMGHFNLNALESASLLECVTGFGGLRRVKMHDLIRDMALKIIGRKGIVKPRKGLKEIPRKDEWTKDLVLVSLMGNSIKGIGNDICPECPNLSVLILRRNPLQNISDSFFVHMAGLTCLDLSKTSIVKLPNSIANLCNLGALLLKGCFWLKIIPSLAGLTKLRDLNLSETAIKELPEGVEKLINLEHLALSGTGIKELPEGVVELINLQDLDVTKTGIQNIPDGLLCKLCKLQSFLSNSKISILPKKLTSLRQLSSFAGWVADFDAFKQFVGSDCFKQLERYSFHVGGPGDFDIYSESCDRLITIHDCQLSIRREECFEVPHNVQILELRGCSFGVESLLEALPSLCAATELERCELAFCKGIKYIISDALSERGRYQVSTPLKGVRLNLYGLDDFVGLYEGRVVPPHIFFGRIKELSIAGCPSVNKIWLQNDDVLPNLEFIAVEQCDNMEEVFGAAEGATIKLPCLNRILLWKLLELKSISGNNVLLPCLDDVVVEWCPKLEMLWSVKDELPSSQMKEVIATTEETTIPWAKFWRLVLTGLPELKSIWGNGVFFPKLDWLSVSECPKLKKIGLLNHNMPSLNKISITKCREMEEIFERGDGAGDDAIQLPNLVQLCLRDLPELRSICRKTVVCNSLKSVYLIGHNKLENCPISVPRLLVSNDPTLRECYVQPKDWWNSLNWNDPATKLAFDKLSQPEVQRYGRFNLQY